MSKQFLFLTTIPNHEQLVPTARDLGRLPGVTSWQAVDGHINLVVQVNGDTRHFLEYLTSHVGDIPVTLCEVLTNGGQPLELSPDYCHAWVLVDVDSSRVEVLRQTLIDTDGVVSAQATRGGCDLAVLIKGPTFAEVDRTVNENIRPLDGVLRLKHHHIINLTTL